MEPRIECQGLAHELAIVETSFRAGSKHPLRSRGDMANFPESWQT
jgi:hypothetical protein